MRQIGETVLVRLGIQTLDQRMRGVELEDRLGLRHLLPAGLENLAHLQTEILLTDLGVPNGLAFDADRGRMYFTDTPTQTVLVADYDADTGARTNVRPFLDYNPLPGKPDGACLDADGCYWSASIYAWSVIRVTPEGVIDRRVELPVEKPTMPAFGGPDLATLYVTSIGAAGSKPSAEGRDGFTPGDLMAVDVGVRGRPEPVFSSD